MDPALAERLASRDVRCPDCGYNLYSLTTPTCPECGAHITLSRLDHDHSPIDPANPAMRLFWIGLCASMLVSLGVVVLALTTGTRITPPQIALIVAGSLGFVAYGPALAVVRVLAVTRPHQSPIDWLLTMLAWAPIVFYPAIFAVAGMF